MDELKILLVDDEDSIRNGMETTIDWKSVGVTEVFTAKDGLQALEIINTQGPHIVITDIRMPECDGIELIKRVRESGDNNTKFIIISGYDDFNYAQKAIKYQVEAYFLKPVNIEQLLSALTKLKHVILSYYEVEKEKEIGKDASIKLKSVLSKNLFFSIINPSMFNQKDIDKRFAEIDLLNFKSPYQIVVFKYTIPKQTSALKLSDKDHSLFVYAFNNILSELFCNTTWETISPKMGYITLIHSQTIKTSALYTLIDAVKNSLDVEMIAGISKPYEDLTQTHIHHEKCLQALEYSIYEMDDNILFDTKILDDVSQSQPPTHQFTDELIDAIIKKDFATIKSELKLFYDKIMYIQYPPPRYVKGVCNYFLIDIARHLSELFKAPEIAKNISYDYINGAKTLAQIKDRVLGFVLNFSDIIQTIKRNQQFTAVLIAQKYIESHATEKILIQDVARRVNLSESYLASIFKKETGLNFRDYVLKCKIDYAKEKLRTTNITVAELSHSLGYDDYRSFVRMFKRSTGMSPSQFMKKRISND